MSITRIVLSLLVFVTLATSAPAQQAPGHWESMIIRPGLHPRHGYTLPLTPLDFSFSDSLHGILLCVDMNDSTICYLTSDGGRSWDSTGCSSYDLSVNLKSPQGDFQNLLKSMAPGSGFIGDRFADIRIDSGRIDAPPRQGQYSNWGISMVNRDTGFRFYSFFGASISVFTRTTDEWYTEDQYGGELTGLTVWAAAMRDSTHLWAGVYYQSAKSAGIDRTTDAGLHWSFSNPQTESTGYGLLVPVLGPTPEEVYITRTYVSDGTFFYSSDGGNNWSGDSALHAPIFRFSAPSSRMLWAITSAVDSTLPAALHYSSDNGVTWAHDTAMLNGEQIEEMHWYGPNRGYIAALSPDSQAVFLRWVPGPPLAVSEEVKPMKTLTIYPNPASETMRIESASTSISISDALGRTILSLGGNSVLDISRLPAGVYYVSDGTHRARFVKE